VPVVELDREVREQFRWEEDQVRKIGRRLLTDALAIGRIFLRVKFHIKQGMWLPWLRQLEFSERTAQRLMNLATRFEDPTLVADLERVQVHIDLSAGYLMAGAVTEVPDQAIAKAERGEHVGKRDIAALIDKSKNQQNPEGTSEAMQQWNQRLITLQRVSRSLATGVIPADLSEAQRTGEVRLISIAMAWLTEAQKRLSSPTESLVAMDDPRLGGSEE
jgi:hypothetical protein